MKRIIGLRLVSLIALFGLLLAACGGTVTVAPTDVPTSPPVAAGKIVISNWDAYMPEDLLTNFTAETGIEATLALHATNEEIVGKLIASKGRGFDVVFVSGQFAQALDKLGLLAKIDHSKIPNLEQLYPEVSQLPFDPGNKFSVPYTWGTTGLCYRSDLLSYTPDSWLDLLQPSAEASGKTTMLATERWLMMPAQKALGFSVNTTDEAEMRQVADLLIETKKTLLAYDDTTFYSKLVSGEAVMVEAWDGWCNYGIGENPDIKFVIPKEGSDLWADTMVILASSENIDAAHAFINYVLSPEVGVWVASNILYKVPSRLAMEQLDPALIAQFPNLGMSPADLLLQEALQDLGLAQSLYTQLVTEILASGP